MLGRKRSELAAAFAVHATVADMDDTDAPADEDERSQRGRHAVLGIGAGLAEHPSVGTSQGETGGATRAKCGSGAKVTFQ